MVKYSSEGSFMIKRIAYYKTVETMNEYKIPILIGLRRTGKSTILKQIKDENQSAEILSIDRLEFRAMTSLKLYEHLVMLINSGVKILLLDEIQIREDWDVILKNLFDEFVANKKVKVVATGSSSLSFEKKDTGVDRTKKILISTLNFNEYLQLTGKPNTYEEFEHFLSYGAFPGYALTDKSFEELKNDTLTPILADDIPSIYKIKTDQLIRLIVELSRLKTGEFNKLSCSSNTGISMSQIDLYIDILKKSQILKVVKRVNEKGQFGRNEKIKIFINPHFHLWLLNKEFKALDDSIKGHIIESYWLFAATQINGYYKEFYYMQNSETKQEIDFVSLNPSGNPAFKTLHEFKYSDSASSRSYNMLATTPSENRVVWCKENKDAGLIKYLSVKDYLG